MDTDELDATSEDLSSSDEEDDVRPTSNLSNVSQSPSQLTLSSPTLTSPTLIVDRCLMFTTLQPRSGYISQEQQIQFSNV